MISTTPKQGVRHSATLVDLPPKPAWSPTFTSMEDIVQQNTKFLWNPYIPTGTATLLFGYGGLGKSWITCAVASALSKGCPLPGQAVGIEPQKILMVSAEDDPGRIIKPRLASFGANMSNIYVSEDAFTLSLENIAALEHAMSSFNATILFLDPLVQYLGGQMDMNRSNEARAMIGPLAEAAKRTDTAIVIVHHAKKDGSGRSANRAMGSADFTNGVRSALMVDELEGGATVMRHVKHNWSEKGVAWRYGVKDGVFSWAGSATDAEIAETSKVPLMQKKARTLIFDLLKDGPRAAEVIVEAAKALNLPVRTLERSKKGIAHSIKVDGKWFWELDGEEGKMPIVVEPTEGVRVSLPVRQESVHERLLREAREKLSGPR